MAEEEIIVVQPEPVRYRVDYDFESPYGRRGLPEPRYGPPRIRLGLRVLQRIAERGFRAKLWLL